MDQSVHKKRKEVTTEGGLNLKNNFKNLKKIIFLLKKRGIRTSLFIEPNISDVAKSKKLGADCIEIHTGKFCNLFNNNKNFSKEFLKIKKSIKYGSKIGLEVHAGHGLTYKSAKKILKINNIKELNIGHFIISESIFVGLRKVILKFKKIIKK